MLVQLLLQGCQGLFFFFESLLKLLEVVKRVGVLPGRQKVFLLDADDVRSAVVADTLRWLVVLPGQGSVVGEALLKAEDIAACVAVLAGPEPGQRSAAAGALCGGFHAGPLLARDDMEVGHAAGRQYGRGGRRFLAHFVISRVVCGCGRHTRVVRGLVGRAKSREMEEWGKGLFDKLLVRVNSLEFNSWFSSHT
eukprot:gene12109-8333_t